MNKTIVITTLLVLVALSAQAQVMPDTISVCFQLASKTKGESATLVYSEFIECKDITLHPVTDGDGRWSVKIPAYRTMHIQIFDQNKIKSVVWDAIDLFCRPGTRADIFLDDINDRCIFSGENADAHNAQIAFPLKIEDMHGRCFNMELQDATNAIRYVRQQNLHNIDSLVKTHPDLPQRYVDALIAISNYGYAMDMTQNIIGHFFGSLGKILQQGNNMPQEYIDLLREVETDELLHPQELLPRWATTYFSDIVRIEDIAQNGIVREASKKSDQQLIIFKGDCAVIDAINASDDVRQIMKTERFLLLCKKEITPKREKFLRSQLTPEAFGQLRNYINGMNAKFEAIPVEQVKALEETPLDSLVDGKEIFQKLISPYRGEVIYVDIWGTWCGPCQREMTFLPQLHDAIDDLPVVCMYLANQSPEDIWRKASRRFGIDGKDCVNIRLPDNQQRAVEDFLGVEGYPTYLLIAPDGTISTNKAPRPSAASEVRKAIEALLVK